MLASQGKDMSGCRPDVQILVTAPYQQSDPPSGAFISPQLFHTNGVETMSFPSILQHPLQHLPALAAVCDCAW